MPHLLLHVGTHKTGTTSIQQALSRDRDRLRSAGIYYPDSKPWFGRDRESHWPFAHALTGTAPDQLDLARRFVDHIRADTSEKETTILSAEAIYRHLDGVDAWQRIRELHARWDAKRRYLERLATVLDDFDVEPMIFLRRPDQFAESVYAEMVTKMLLQEPFHQWREALTWLCNYDRHVDLYRNIFGKMTVFRYEDAAGQVDKAFFEHIGLDPPKESLRERRSADARVILWMRLAQPGTRPQRFAFAASDEAINAFDDYGSPTLWESLEQRLDFLRRFEGPYGCSYFDPPTDERSIATLDDKTAGRIAAAWSRWIQH